MKNALTIILVLLLFGCGNQSPKDKKFDGSFKYIAYRWNDNDTVVGISLWHYLEINKTGDYKLILRNDDGSAAYYYGYVNNQITDGINELFKKDLKGNFSYDSTKSVIYDGPDYKFDWTSSSADKKINFIPPYAPRDIKNLQSSLDSLIQSPGKKQSAPFNIDSYLKKIIAEDSATRLKSTVPVKVK